MYIQACEEGRTIPLVNSQALDKSMKSSIFVCMIFVKNLVNSDCVSLGESESSKKELDLSKFLKENEDVFIDDIPCELPPKRGDDDHFIELFPGVLHLIGLLIESLRLNKRRS